MKLAVVDKSGKKKSEIELKPEIFGVEYDPFLIKSVIDALLSNQRRSFAKTKTRSEISKSTKKLYRQKGTGRARAGSASAGNRRGGYAIFGPTGKESYYKQVNKKTKRKALFSALSYLAQNDRLMILDDLSIKEPKTKEALKVLDSIKITGSKNLFLLNLEYKNSYLGLRNIPKQTIKVVNTVNVKDVMFHERLILDVNSLENLYKVFLNTENVD
jgi:large subunit ribosomal protein L4